jgi:hypothetical protein
MLHVGHTLEEGHVSRTLCDFHLAESEWQAVPTNVSVRVDITTDGSFGCYSVAR